jgi:hypothetical protein
MMKLSNYDDEIHHANEKTVSRIVSARPRLVGVRRATRAIPRMKKNVFLHAGPRKLSWDQMTGAMKGAVIGAMLYEGLAENPTQAYSRAEEGAICFESAHDYGSVSPMAGMISPSMPVFVVENLVAGNFAFCTINEGVGRVKTLRYGAYSGDVIKRLNWIQEVLAPNVSDALTSAGGIDLKQIISEALRRGDECHNRNKAATSIFLKIIGPHVVRASTSKKVAAEILEFVGANDHFFLNLSMAASKATLDYAHGIRNSTIVTGMSSNGCDFGVRVSGLGAKQPPYQWYVARSPFARGKYFSGYDRGAANRVLGDSYVSECVGIGAFAMAASPAISEFVGGTPRWAENQVREMQKITWGKHKDFLIPYMNFVGAPTGIDIHKIARNRILPILNTGIAHKKAGIGQIGAGLFRAPAKCFEKANKAWSEHAG